MADGPLRYEGLSALVVDDDPAVRLILRRMLEKLGFRVQVSEDGATALKLAAEKPPNIVISDLAMPTMDGLDFMREARAQGIETPVVFLSATGSVPTAVQAIKSGAFEFLEKPLRADRLEQVVRAAMASGAARPTRPLDERASSLSLSVNFEEAAAPTDTLPQRLQRDHIGRYEVMRRIGRGGMGVVWQCRDPLLGRMVAVKVVHMIEEAQGQGDEIAMRFRREAAAAAALAHPCIVAIHDLGMDEERGDWFIVMELLKGRDLHVVLKQDRRLPLPGVLSLGFQMADALAFAHARGIVHRDIKPSNVVVQPGGSVKLLDFGLAAVQGWDLTSSGRVFGSPSYMAPERVQGNAGAAAVDQFSLGVVLYQAVTGMNPFDADTAEARLKRVIDFRPQALGAVDANVPTPLSEAVARLMQKDPAERYPSMDDATEALLRVGSEHGLALRRHT